MTTNVGSATAKTSEEFTNGTVAKLLGEAFAQGKLYPVFATDPADYTKVDAAIAQVNTLNKDNYKDFSAVEAAVNAVDRDKKIAEQPAVDAMAEAIEHAIADLQYKDADYTKVDAAIAKANALKKNDYKGFLRCGRCRQCRCPWQEHYRADRSGCNGEKPLKMQSQHWSKSLLPVAVFLPAVPLPRAIP